jgi:hypothetical protein
VQFCFRQTVQIAQTAIVCGLLMIAGIVDAYSTRTFEGDGVISDQGFWSYKPRYRIELRPTLSLTTMGRHQFRFRGVPADPLSGFLVIQNSEHHDYERLRTLSTMVELTLADSNDMTVCRASGPLSDWTLMWSSGRSGAYWQRQCTDLRLQTNQWYVLSVAVRSVDSSSPPVRVVAQLTGGGWDSP